MRQADRQTPQDGKDRAMQSVARVKTTTSAAQLVPVFNYNNKQQRVPVLYHVPLGKPKALDFPQWT